MRNVLLYLATHGVEQPGKSVKEFEIATNALGRGDDYDPRSDSTVRVVASRLRSKLAEYYTQEGAADPVIISIPKGAYFVSGSYRHNGHSNGNGNGNGNGHGEQDTAENPLRRRGGRCWRRRWRRSPAQRAGSGSAGGVRNLTSRGSSLLSGTSSWNRIRRLSCTRIRRFTARRPLD